MEVMQAKADYRYERACDKWLRTEVSGGSRDGSGGEVKEKFVRVQWADVVHDVAEVLLPLFEHRFVCSSFNKGQWWTFDRHRWERDELGVRKLFDNEAHKAFCSYAEAQQQKARQQQDENGRKQCERRAKAAREI